jgi:hypothetical protein
MFSGEDGAPIHIIFHRRCHDILTRGPRSECGCREILSRNLRHELKIDDVIVEVKLEWKLEHLKTKDI